MRVTIFKDSQVRILKDGGAMRDRTADLLRARQALSQLSYNPKYNVIQYFLRSIGGSEVDLNHRPHPLSGVRSNQLSYRPNIKSLNLFNLINLCEHS